MATTYRYGLQGVGSNVQIGRRGGHLDWVGASNVYRFLQPDNATLANIRVSTTPTDANDAVSKTYVDSLVAGLSPKDAVRVATTAAGTLATSFAAGSVIDGVTLVAGDRILIKNQATASENGIYDVTAGAPTRSADADSSTDLGAAFVFVMEGTVGAGDGWVTSFTDTQTLGTDPVAWTQFSAAGAYTASNGVQISGSDIQLNLSGLTGTTATVTTDEVPFYDVSGAAHLKRTWADIITDLNITTSGSLIGGTGINLTGSTLSFDNSGMVDTVVVGTDTVPFFDASASNQAEFRSWANIITDLTIRTGTVAVANGGTGLTTIPAYSVLVANTLDTVTALSATDTGGNQLLQWNDTSNAFEFVTTASVGGNAFGTISIAGGNNAGDTSVVADAIGDTLSLNGGDGITITGVAASDTLTLALSNAGMVDTAVVGTDTVPFFDASATNQPEFRSWANILADLDIVNNITANGIPVRTAADTYASRTITASATASEEGIVITNGDGVAGNPTIGLDINALTADTTTAATDEFVYFNGTNNVKIDRDSLANELQTATNGVQVVEGSFALVNNTAVGTIPANARILRIRVYIDTAYDASADIQVNAVTGGDLMTETTIDAALVGGYEDAIDYRNTTGAAETIQIQVVNGTPTVGAGRCIIEYYSGSAI